MPVSSRHIDCDPGIGEFRIQERYAGESSGDSEKVVGVSTVANQGCDYVAGEQILQTLANS